MNTPRKLPLLLIFAQTLGCIGGDDDPADGASTDDGVQVSDVSTSLEILALNCNYRALFLTALEAADDFPENPPTHAEMYQVTDGCLEQVEQVLTDHGITLDFAGPFETDVNHRAILEAIHSMFFSPMFTPPLVDGAPPVFDINSDGNPYPSTLAAVIPVVPASYEYEIPASAYNEEIALTFMTTVTAIEDHTAFNAQKVAELVGTTVELHGQFDHRYTTDPQKTAALLAHEVAHSYLPGHKSCDVASASCGVAGFALDADCDCDYEQSTYWVEAAFAEAAALGRVVSFAPAANQPIDGGVAVVGHFPTARCVDAASHVTPFRETKPRCASLIYDLVEEIEANSSYWDGL